MGGNFDPRKLAQDELKKEAVRGAKDVLHDATHKAPGAEPQSYSGVQGLETELAKLSLEFPKGQTTLSGPAMEAIAKLLDRPESRTLLNREGKHTVVLHVQGGNLKGIDTPKRVAALEAFVERHLDGATVVVDHRLPARGSESLHLLNITISDAFVAAKAPKSATEEDKQVKVKTYTRPESEKDFLEDKELMLTAGIPLGEGRMLFGVGARNPQTSAEDRLEVGFNEAGTEIRYQHDKSLGKKIAVGSAKGSLRAGYYADFEHQPAVELMGMELKSSENTLKAGAVLGAEIRSKRANLKLEGHVGFGTDKEIDAGVRATVAIPIKISDE